MAKTIKIGINGFGRIGRFVFRAAMSRPDITVVGINDLCPVDYLAYMLKYDTMHGAFEGTIKADVEKSLLIVNGKKIRVTACKDAAELAWDKVGAEYIVEATGLNLTKEKAEAHIKDSSFQGRYTYVRMRCQREDIQEGNKVCFQRILHHKLSCTYRKSP